MVPFFALAGGIVFFLSRVNPEDVAIPDEEPEREPEPQTLEEQQLDEFVETDRVILEISATLRPLVKQQRKGITDRVAEMRRELTRKHGLWVPLVRIRETVDTDANSYRMLITGRQVADGAIRPDLMLMIGEGRSGLEIEGEETIEPAFGLKARWITPGWKARAELAGYAVVDAVSVLITHLGEVLRSHAHETLSREDLQQMINKVRETHPSLVEELKPEALKASVLHQVVTRLLRERVPVTNLPRILEAALNQAAQHGSDPVALTESVRDELGPMICNRYRDEEGRIRVIVMEPGAEAGLQELLRDRQCLALGPKQLERLLQFFSAEWQKRLRPGSLCVC